MTRTPSLHVADSHDLIRVHGARENNLKDLSVEIPKRRLTVFTGISGSGKSSLVFDTIAAESQRLINETYSAFVQGFMPTLARPEVDVLEGLTTAIIVDQQRMGADIRSTVGTATDANAMLRILFSRLGQPQIGSPNAFSFNVPSVRARGAITVERGEGKTVKKSFTRSGGMCPRCEGLGTEAMQPHACPECGGTRLSEAARSSRIGGINIADACAMQISDLAQWVRTHDEPSVAPLLSALQSTLDSFTEIGLGYLSLDRPPVHSRSAARARTTCATSTSTFRSACLSSSPASPARARARSCTGRSRTGMGTVSCRSTRQRSRARGGATRRRTADCSTRSARRSRRPTACSRRCSAPTPRVPAPTATAPA